MRSLNSPSRASSNFWYRLPLLVLASVLAGFAAATESPVLIASIAGLVGLLFFIAIPPYSIILAIFGLSFVVVGLIGYFGRLEQIYWLPYLLGLMLYLHVAAAALSLKPAGHRQPPSFFWAVVAFLVAVLASALINLIAPLQLVIATKNYLFLWSVFFILAFGITDERLFQRLWQGLLVVAAIQLPVALFQYVRAGAHGWDAVSGTFGGSETGGASGFLGLSMIVALTLMLALLREKLLSWKMATALALLCLAPVAMAEVKAAVILFLPIALFLLYYKDLKRNPLVFLWLAGFGAAIVIGTFTIYQFLHYSQVDTGQRQRPAIERITEAIDLETDSTYVRKLTGEMSRIGILVFWWREHSLSQADKILFGHGPGSLRSSSFYLGEIARKYPFYRMDRHAIAFLLWDLGLVGLGTFALVLLGGIRLSFSLSDKTTIPILHRTYLRVGAVTLALLSSSLIYNRSVIDSAAGQALFMLCLGQAAFWHARGGASPLSCIRDGTQDSNRMFSFRLAGPAVK